MAEFPDKLWFGPSIGTQRTWRRPSRRFDAPEAERGEAAESAWERVAGTEMAHAGYGVYFFREADARSAADVLAAAAQAGAAVTVRPPVGPHLVGEGALSRWKLSFNTQQAAGLAYDVLFEAFYGKAADAE